MASIVVIHEHRDVCDMLCPVIVNGGHQCVAHSNLKAALDDLGSSRHDIVILDIDGSETPEEDIRSLTRARCRPSVLILSDGGAPESLERAIRAGAWDVICSPFTHDELNQAITRCLFHRQARIEFCTTHSFRREGILGSSAALERCLQNVATAAQTGTAVLILGETGTGKELFANAIHENSSRASGSFIVVDCTNIPKTLAESLLFGHERGSFTGASDSREGLFKQADGGTIFLDEIGDLDYDVQKSLLRVLQERRFRPLSSKREIVSDFRLVAATNQDLSEMVASGRFRQDLYHRLCGRVIKLPPLRERKEDIVPISNYHIHQICLEIGCPPKEISYELHHALTLYDWPGNVRELINALHAAAHNALAESRLYPQHLPMDIRARVLSRHNGRAFRNGSPSGGPCTCGLTAAPCPLGCHEETSRKSLDLLAAPPARAGAREPGVPALQAGVDTGPQAQRGPAVLHSAPGDGPDPLTPGNGRSRQVEPSILLPLSAQGRPDDGLLPLSSVRELAMQEVEAHYLRNLVTVCRGNFQRALAMSGLSRARLYDLLKKHSMSISGNAANGES